MLKRGVANSPALWEWFEQVRQGTLDRRDIIVTLLNEERQPVVVWKLRRCLPIKYVGPTLSAAESDVAIEEIELAVEGLDIEQIGLRATMAPSSTFQCVSSKSDVFALFFGCHTGHSPV